MKLAISLSAGIAVPRVSANAFVRMSKAEQESYLEAYPKSSHQYLNAEPPGVINLADRLDVKPKEVATYLREPMTNKLLGACGKGFGTLFNTIDQVLKLPNQGLQKGFEVLHKTKAFQSLHKGTIKVDKFLEKYPVLKKAGGPLVAGALAYQWLNMSFSGDFDDDFNIDDMVSALQGEYSIEQLLGTPSGLKGCAQLITGLATGGLLSFPWHSKMNIAFAAAYTGARRLGQTDVAQKMFKRWKANPDKGRKTLEAKAGTMKIQINASSKKQEVLSTTRELIKERRKLLRKKNKELIEKHKLLQKRKIEEQRNLLKEQRAQDIKALAEIKDPAKRKKMKARLDKKHEMRKQKYNAIRSKLESTMDIVREKIKFKNETFEKVMSERYARIKNTPAEEFEAEYEN